MRRQPVLMAIFAVIFLLAFAPQAWNTLERGWYWVFPVERENDSVSSTESAQELSRKGLRNQLISFENIQNIDRSKYEIFAMGVGQVTLKKPEVSPNAKVTVTGSRVQRKDYTSNSPLTTVTAQQVTDAGHVEASRPYQVYGDFNNIVLFDRKAGTFTTVFDKRIAISRFQTGWRTPKDILIIFGTDADSDGDGDIGRGDLEDIFIYTLADKQMHRIALRDMGAASIVDMPNADYLIVQYKVDRNRDGEIGSYYSDSGAEPATFIRIDLKTFEAKPFVPSDIVQKLQTTLEAVPPESAPPQPTAPQPAKP